MYLTVEIQEYKKERDAEAKRKRLEDAERKRAAMQAAMNKQDQRQTVQPKFVIQKRSDGGPGAALGSSGFDRVSLLTIWMKFGLYCFNRFSVH